MTAKQSTEMIISLPTANRGEGTQPEGENRFRGINFTTRAPVSSVAAARSAYASSKKLQKLQSRRADRVRGC